MTRVRVGSATSIAPRTDSSASMFCGGTWVAGDGGIRESGIDGGAAERGVRAESVWMDSDQTKGGARAEAGPSQMPGKRNDTSVAEARALREASEERGEPGRTAKIVPRGGWADRGEEERPDAPRGRVGYFSSAMIVLTA